MQDLWQKYQSVVFELEQAVSPSLNLAIITAYNPRGKVLSEGHNRMLDKALLRDIDALKAPYRRIVGRAADHSHSEASWLIGSSKEEAVALAKCYQQNAIYWVESSQLYLTPCVMDTDEVCLGSFDERVILTENCALQ